MRILKFGGTSVANADRISKLYEIVNKINNEEQCAVVVSALSGVTDSLIKMLSVAKDGGDFMGFMNTFVEKHHYTVDQLFDANKAEEINKYLDNQYIELKDTLIGVSMLHEASNKTKDLIASFGERSSAYIISQYFNTRGLLTTFLDARLVIKTNSNYGNAIVDFAKTTEAIQNQFDKIKGTVAVITGFIGSDNNGCTTTLGRGGSDYSASIFAYALDVKVLEIWTDVDGVLTTNPKKVSSAYTIPQLSYEEAMELSHFGAKVIYPPTIQPALDKNIGIYIKNTFNPDFIGTYISAKKVNSSHSRIVGISSIDGISLITIEGPGMMGIPGTSARFFGALGRANANIIMIAQGSSEHAIMVAIKSGDVSNAVLELEQEFDFEQKTHIIRQFKVETGFSILAIVGEGMKKIPGVAGKLFSCLGKNGINIIGISQGSSELNISFIIKEHDEDKALNTIHQSFFQEQKKVINLFVAGVGLISSTLLIQIAEHTSNLYNDHNMSINLIGIARSNKFLVNKNGIEIGKNTITQLMENGTDGTIDQFIDLMIEANLSNMVFVDNTVGEVVPAFYQKILSDSISIVTPNKAALSASYETYKSLRSLAKDKNIDFKFETNVGAGLPVISTLENLISSGDEITKIEGVLSGSLSFLFNHLKIGVKFSDLVKQARENGFTEPDPREDLNGSDVKRKIIILARTAGFHLEPDDVQIENLFSIDSQELVSVDDFLQSLSDEDAHFDTLLKKAKDENKVLRYIALYENGKATVHLESVGMDSPFASLAHNDNMIVFHTKRYNTRPLVIQGPGAGASVTAAGVFADIISLGSKISS